MATFSEDHAPPGAVATTVILGLVVFVLSAAVRLGHLDTPPIYDELYHLIAGRSWLENGTFAIADGVYARTPLYTRMTAWAFSLFGDTSVASARIPNVVLGSLLASLTVVWVYRVTGGRAAALVATLLVVLWPSGIHISQYIRFYALHGMLFFFGAISVYAMCAPRVSWAVRGLMLVLALAFLKAALEFQDTTKVGALCLLVWIGLWVVLPAIWRSERRWLILGGLALALMAAGAAALRLGNVEELWVSYRYSPWPRDPMAYNRELRDTYPLLWALTPLLAIAALVRFPRPAGFCLVLSMVGLLIHSFAGLQNIRYVYYLTPFLFALWAMGVQATCAPVLEATRTALTRLLGPRGDGLLGSLIIAGVLLFLIGVNAAVPRSTRLALGKMAPPMIPRSDWSDGKARVAEYRDAGVVIATENDLYAIEYLGGMDVTYSQNWIAGLEEFDNDPRTGRPLIRKLSSLETLVSCRAEGIFVTDNLWAPPGWTAAGSFLSFFHAFQQPGTSYTIENAGPLQIVHWRTQAPGSNGAVDCGQLPESLS